MALPIEPLPSLPPVHERIAYALLLLNAAMREAAEDGWGLTVSPQYAHNEKGKTVDSNHIGVTVSIGRLLGPRLE